MVPHNLPAPGLAILPVFSVANPFQKGSLFHEVRN